MHPSWGILGLEWWTQDESNWSLSLTLSLSLSRVLSQVEEESTWSPAMLAAHIQLQEGAEWRAHTLNATRHLRSQREAKLNLQHAGELIHKTTMLPLEPNAPPSNHSLAANTTG